MIVVLEDPLSVAVEVVSFADLIIVEWTHPHEHSDVLIFTADHRHSCLSCATRG